MEDKLIELLKGIGLTKNEIEVYLDLLKNPVSTAYTIGHRINRHRSGIYEALKKLMQKGLIVEIQEEKRKLYQTKESSAIEEYLKQKLAELNEINPYLKEVSNTKMPPENVSVSYGLSRLRAIFSEIAGKKSEIFIWTLSKKVEEVLGDWFIKELNELITKQDASLKVICSKSFNSQNETNKNSFANVKYIDEETNIFTITYEDSVFLIVLANPLIAIEINNPLIAEGFKSRFHTLWEKADKQKVTSST